MGKIVTHVNSSITGVYSKEFRDIINDYVSKNKTCTSSLNNAIDIYDEFLNSTNKTIENKNFRLVDTNYIDNGKLMLSTNMMGTLELYLNLIKKIGGNDLEEKLKAEIGLKK